MVYVKFTICGQKRQNPFRSGVKRNGEVILKGNFVDKTPSKGFLFSRF